MLSGAERVKLIIKGYDKSSIYRLSCAFREGNLHQHRQTMSNLTHTSPATVPAISVADIRKSFLDFYAGKGHAVVPSSSLVPGNDPTLMFTNSGMVQFKDVFLGTDKRSYVRAASVQAGKCRLYRSPSHIFRNAGQLELW